MTIDDTERARLRAIRNELLHRRHEREHGPVLLVEVLGHIDNAQRPDGSYAPHAHIPTPESLRGRSVTRLCLPVSGLAPPGAYRTPGLYRSEARGLVRLTTELARCR